MHDDAIHLKKSRPCKKGPSSNAEEDEGDRNRQCDTSRRRKRLKCSSLPCRFDMRTAEPAIGGCGYLAHAFAFPWCSTAVLFSSLSTSIGATLPMDPAPRVSTTPPA